MPKYVVSSSLEDPDWSNSRALRGDAVDEVSRLKQEYRRRCGVAYLRGPREP